jgi:formate dehydrogenase subunit gamma
VGLADGLQRIHHGLNFAEIARAGQGDGRSRRNFESEETVFSGRGFIGCVGAVACFMLLVVNFPAYAQSKQPESVNPSASAVKEDQLLRELDRVTGRVTIQDARAGTLIQPEGRQWRQFHEMTLPTYGAYGLLGMLALLILFYLVRGKVRLESGRSGRTIVRFGGFPRFVHWLTAVSFILLALSGLNVVFGKTLLPPLIGESAFATTSQWAKYAHDYLSVPFTVGLVFMVLIWIWDNLPSAVDFTWLAEGGGIIGHNHPPAGKFNAGQKLIFWAVILIGGAIAVSGYYLMFPFYVTNIAGMQLAQVVHSVAGVVLIAVILAHIYIGTVGMEGAFEAMGTGEVDLNWAKEHHSLWVEKEEGKASHAVPAE